MKAYPHERFWSEVQLTPTMVATYAQAVGDTNPVHHDAAFAAATRYGRLIASGTHTTALLLGLTAAHFSQRRWPSPPNNRIQATGSSVRSCLAPAVSRA